MASDDPTEKAFPITSESPLLHTGPATPSAYRSRLTSHTVSVCCSPFTSTPPPTFFPTTSAIISAHPAWKTNLRLWFEALFPSSTSRCPFFKQQGGQLSVVTRDVHKAELRVYMRRRVNSRSRWGKPSGRKLKFRVWVRSITNVLFSTTRRTVCTFGVFQGLRDAGYNLTSHSLFTPLRVPASLRHSPFTSQCNKNPRLFCHSAVFPSSRGARLGLGQARRLRDGSSTTREG